MTTIKFIWNGIKIDRTLFRCSYSWGDTYTDRSQTSTHKTLTIYRKDYVPELPKAIYDLFTVINNTETMTDYFEHDHFRVTEDHPLFAEIWAAYQAQEVHNSKRWEKKREKCKGRRIAVLTESLANFRVHMVTANPSALAYAKRRESEIVAELATYGVNP